MSTIEYSLFRAKFLRPKQMQLFAGAQTPRELFLGAIYERPTAELRRGYQWHVGNITEFDESTGYFAVGRTTGSTVEKFDRETGDFVLEELETSPYTHVVFDATIGLVAIAQKPILAPTAKGIAAKLAALFAESRTIQSKSVDVEIVPIPNPDGFVLEIQRAFKVTRFTATFHRPNPIDADAVFQTPLSVYLQAAHGESGKAQITGSDLDRETVVAVANSSAATGNEASARIKRHRSSKPTTVNLNGDPVKRKYDDASHDPKIVLKEMTALYHQIRDDEGNTSKQH